MGPRSDTNPIVSLDEDTCWQLLRNANVGRLVVNVGSQPDIFPVNYVIDEGEIVVRTAEGTKLAAAIMGGRVAFEIDDLDDGARTGWSVVVHGLAREAHDLLAVMRDDEIDTSPWADGAKERVIRILPDGVTGRRIGSTSEES
jgi:nitroimidazol reductase NimA-like FMN-containing flavoprotein (pyridoxamine 5'-phosphate oxidase superfamily)